MRVEVEQGIFILPLFDSASRSLGLLASLWVASTLKGMPRT